MRYSLAFLTLAVGALSGPLKSPEKCCFNLKVVGDVVGHVSQHLDGVFHLGGHNPPAEFCMHRMTKIVTDDQGKKCHVDKKSGHLKCEHDLTKGVGAFITDGLNLLPASLHNMFACHNPKTGHHSILTDLVHDLKHKCLPIDSLLSNNECLAGINPFTKRDSTGLDCSKYETCYNDPKCNMPAERDIPSGCCKPHYHLPRPNLLIGEKGLESEHRVITAEGATQYVQANANPRHHHHESMTRR